MSAAESGTVVLPMRVVEIEALIPHRYPFLFVDMVTEFEMGKSITGIKNVTANEHFFTGHFPGRPTMPGVLMLEALAQLGAIFAKLNRGAAIDNKLIVFAGADSTRFRRQVGPGDQLTLTMELVRARLGYWKMQGYAKVGTEVAAEAILHAAEVDFQQ